MIRDSFHFRPFFARQRLRGGFFAVLVTALLGSVITFPIPVAEGATGGISGDAANSSWYPTQTLLTPSAVASNFGELYRTALNGQIFAQPLVYRGIVLVATESDMVYGVDAATGAVVWSDALTNLNNSNLGTPSSPYQGCTDIGTQLGVTSTPVIDTATGVAYIMADVTVAGTPQYRLFALNVATGTVATGWGATGVQIQGNAANSNPTFPQSPTVFDAAHETQRTGLVLVNGVVYAGFSAQCDYQPYQGWVSGVSTTTHAVTSLWSSSVTNSAGAAISGSGIWQSGGAPVVDAKGNLYYTTGNSFGKPYPSPETGLNHPLGSYSEAVVKLGTANGQLSAQDWFTPANAVSLDQADLDIASGGPMALPPSMATSTYPNVLVNIAKSGVLQVLNMNNLGGYKAGAGGGDNVISSTSATGGAWSHPALWPGDGGYVYATVTGQPGGQYPGNAGTIDAFKESYSPSGAPLFTLAGTTVGEPNGSMKFGSSSPLITSNGTASGSALLWVEELPNGAGGTGTLDAYNPVPQNNGSGDLLKLVWQSPQTFPGEKLTEPGVGDNMLFVGTRWGQLIGYGLTQPALATANDVDFGSTQVGTSTLRYATITATAPETVNAVNVSASAFTVAAGGPTFPQSLVAGQTLSVPITFSPTASGTNLGQCTFNLASQSSTAPPTALTVNLTGTEVSSVNFSAPAVTDFGTLPISGQPVTKQVTITNTSTQTATVDSLDLLNVNSSYAVSAATTTAVIPPAGTYTFVVTFTPPGTAGDYSHDFPSLVTLRTSIGNVAVPLFAVAAPQANLALTQSTLNFGRVRVGGRKTLTLRLLDNGGLSVRITAASVVAAPFTTPVLVKRGSVFSGNADVTIPFTFSPRAKKVFTLMWTITGNDGSGPHRVTLTGSGV